MARLESLLLHLSIQSYADTFFCSLLSSYASPWLLCTPDKACFLQVNYSCSPTPKALSYQQPVCSTKGIASARCLSGKGQGTWGSEVLPLFQYWPGFSQLVRSGGARWELFLTSVSEPRSPPLPPNPYSSAHHPVSSETFITLQECVQPARRSWVVLFLGGGGGGGGG